MNSDGSGGDSDEVVTVVLMRMARKVMLMENGRLG